MAVYAFMLPPTASISAAMSEALRLSVPLNTMCSIKWDMPDSAPISYTEPACIHTAMDTERNPVIS